MRNSYVIFWNDYWGLYKQSFSDLNNKPYARCIWSPTDYMSHIPYFAYKLYTKLKKFSRRRGLAWGDGLIKPDIWFPMYFQGDFSEKNNLVFVFSPYWLKGEHVGYVDFLKQRYPQCRFVLFCCDLWNTLGLDINYVKSTMDLILSFDQNDCKKYGFLYHPLVFSEYHGDLEKMPKSDVYFLGQPKDRFSKIISCLEKMWENDVTTDIQLVNVAPEEQVYKDKITYIDQWVPYKTNLHHFMHANCVLELMQRGGVGYTQRMCEAIAFDKKIITNNALIHEAPFYNPNYIFQITSADDISPELCECIKKEEKVDYHYKEKISPVELLEFIEKNLEGGK